MFRKKLIIALLKPQKLNISKADRLIDSGFIAICIIFLQYLLSVEKPDFYQFTSLFMFSIAIPMLALHFLGIQTITEQNLILPAFLVKSFGYLHNIGLWCTGMGIFMILVRVSWVLPLAYTLSIGVGWTVIGFISYFSMNAKKEEKQKSE